MNHFYFMFFVFSTPKTNIKVDIVPVDFVINSTLAVACKTSKAENIDENFKIFNCVNSDPHPTRFLAS